MDEYVECVQKNGGNVVLRCGCLFNYFGVPFKDNILRNDQLARNIRLSGYTKMYHIKFRQTINDINDWLQVVEEHTQDHQKWCKCM